MIACLGGKLLRNKCVALVGAEAGVIPDDTSGVARDPVSHREASNAGAYLFHDTGYRYCAVVLSFRGLYSTEQGFGKEERVSYADLPPMMVG